MRSTEDNPLVVLPAGVLGNDVDADGDALAATDNSLPGNASAFFFKCLQIETGATGLEPATSGVTGPAPRSRR
jgi:hypothetical protein